MTPAPDLLAGPTRVLVCGDRYWTDTETLYARLDRLPRADLVIIEGEARGADTLARQWAESRSVAYLPFPANWNLYGKRAGILRNQQMLDEGKPHCVIAFHHNLDASKGTRDMVKRAREAGLPTEVVP